MAVDKNYALTLVMITTTMGMIVVGVKFGVNPELLPTKELIGGLLVLAGRLITSN